MTSVLYVAESTLSREQADFAMAKIQTVLRKASYSASPLEIVQFFESDGVVRPSEDEVHSGFQNRLLLDWLEIQFPELAGYMSVHVDCVKRVSLHLQTVDPDGETFRTMQDVPSAFYEVCQGSWAK